jgi:hypothetical protein
MVHRAAVTIVAWMSLALSVETVSSRQSTTLPVRALDCALQMSDSIRAGTHSWRFRNDGKSRLELIFARLQAGTDVEAVTDSLQARGLRAFFATESMALAVGGLFAPPGVEAAAEIVTHDRAGGVLLAFSQLRDAPDKPKHDDLGMFKVVRVR